MSTHLRIVIAEPSPVLRIGLVQLLKRMSGVRMHLDEISDITLLTDFLKKNQPDLLIVNPGLLGYFSLPLLKEECNCRSTKTIALVYSLTDTSLLKQYDEYISILDTPDQIEKKISRMANLHEEEESLEEEETQNLSPREKEIVVGVVKGLTNREIAEQLFLSTHTVVTHRRNIARKLQIHSVSGLTVYAIVNKLVDLDAIKK